MVLQNNAPYMLRNDGEIFKVNKSHPYIVDKRDFPKPSSIRLSDIEYEIFDDDNNSLEWFYNHTKYEATKKDIEALVVGFCNYVSGNLPDWIGIPSFDIDISLDELQHQMMLVTDECNQEFLRVRTGGLYNPHNDSCIYFRVSSIGYNWFDQIWNVLYDNQNKYKTVYIEKDRASFGTENVVPYIIQGETVEDFPIPEFLMLNGKPIMESFNNSRYSHIWKELMSGTQYSEALKRNVVMSNKIRPILEEIDKEVYYT